MYTTRMDQKCTNDTRFYYNKDMDDNLQRLAQKTGDSKSNKGNLTFPTHTVNVIEPSGNKKSGNHPISTSTPLFRFIPPFLAKKFDPPPK